MANSLGRHNGHHTHKHITSHITPVSGTSHTSERRGGDGGGGACGGSDGAGSVGVAISTVLGAVGGGTAAGSSILSAVPCRRRRHCLGYDACGRASDACVRSDGRAASNGRHVSRAPGTGLSSSPLPVASIPPPTGRPPRRGQAADMCTECSVLVDSPFQE